MRALRKNLCALSLLTLAWQALFMFAASIALCDLRNEALHYAASKVADCPVHGSRAAAMAGMAMDHDGSQPCDCAIFKCSNDGAGVAISAPAALLPSLTAMQAPVSVGQSVMSVVPIANRLAALPLAPPPRA